MVNDKYITLQHVIKIKNKNNYECNIFVFIGLLFLIIFFPKILFDNIVDNLITKS